MDKYFEEQPVRECKWHWTKSDKELNPICIVITKLT